MKPRVAILGGGTGGVMVANRLARALASGWHRDVSAEILLVTDQDRHFYQPGLLYVALGLKDPAVYERSERDLLLPGVKLRVGAAERIDLTNRRLQFADGSTEAFDYLVIATGSEPDLSAIPGFAQGAYSFYTLPEALRLRSALQAFAAGKLLMVIGVPHKCPVAPLEFLLMYEDLLRQTQRRNSITLTYTYPIGRLHSLEPLANWVETVFASRGIESETFFNPENIDGNKRTVQTLEGEDVGYDMLVGVPPHRGAAVIRQSALGDVDGWLPTDAYTLALKGTEGVYVVGDATDLPLSKAGSTAHYEASVVVQNLLSELAGEKPSAAYDGKVFCFIESSASDATHITFDYRHPPKPTLPADAVHWFKLAFNQMYWLSLRGLV